MNQLYVIILTIIIIYLLLLFLGKNCNKLFKSTSIPTKESFVNLKPNITPSIYNYKYIDPLSMFDDFEETTNYPINEPIYPLNDPADMNDLYGNNLNELGVFMPKFRGYSKINDRMLTNICEQEYKVHMC